MLKDQKKATLLEISTITVDAFIKLHDIIIIKESSTDNKYKPEAQDKLNKIIEKLKHDLDSVCWKIMNGEK
jgi:hypothetical protein